MHPLLALVVAYFAAMPESSQVRMHAALFVLRLVNFKRWRALEPWRRQQREAHRARLRFLRGLTPAYSLSQRVVEVFATRPRALMHMVLFTRLPRFRMRIARREARRRVAEAYRRYPHTIGILATTNNHTDIASGAAANAAIINAPLGQLDQALSDLAINLKSGASGCIGNGVADDTANFGGKITATPAGGVLWMPIGNYLVTSVGTECLKPTHPIHMIGAGYGTVILVKTGTGAAVDVIHIVPATATSADATMYLFEDFRIVAQSGTPARHAFNFDTLAAGAFIRQSEISRCWTDPFGGNSFSENNAAGNTNGGIFEVQLRDTFFGGGLDFTGAGDSVTVDGCTVCAMSNGTNAGAITVALVSGAGSFIMRDTNYQGTGGLIITKAITAKIVDNNMQIPYTFVGANAAYVNLAGSIGFPLRTCKVEDNIIAVLAGGGAIDAVRVDRATKAKIDDNDLSAPSGNTHINITANANGTVIGSGNTYNGAGTAITNAGTGTIQQSATLYYSEAADSTSIASTNVETAFSKSFAVPPFELRPGDMIRVKAQGVLNTTGTPTVTFRLRMGGVSIGHNAYALGALAGVAFGIEADVILRSIAANVGTFQPGRGNSGVEGGSMQNTQALGTLTLSTNVAITVDATITFSVSAAGNNATLRALSVEILRAGSVS